MFVLSYNANNFIAIVQSNLFKIQFKPINCRYLKIKNQQRTFKFSNEKKSKQRREDLVQIFKAP